MADSGCLFDVIENIPTLHDAFEREGLVTAQDLGPYTSAKKFAVIKCVRAFPSRAEGSAKEFQNRLGHPNHVCQKEDIALYLTTDDKHRYEMITAVRPARLFFDLEWNEGECSEHYVVERVFDLLNEYCYGHSIFSKHVTLECVRSNTTKQSFHIMFPDAIFQQIDGDMKVFILGFARWIVEEKKGAGLCYVKTLKNGKRQTRTVIDTAVYTKNRNFRMLNQSKWDEKTCTPMTWQGGAKPDWAKVSDTLVQPLCISNKDEILTVIADILNRRAPKDGKYPLYPEKGVIGWRMKSSPTPPMHRRCFQLVIDVRQKLGEKLTVYSNEDIANAIDSKEMRQADFTGLFLPVLVSLCPSLSDDFLKNWIGSQDVQKSESRIAYARHCFQKVSADQLVSCQVALDYLKKRYNFVIDARKDPRLIQSKLCTIEATLESGWEAVAAGNDMKDKIKKICNQDTRYIGTKNETRRLFFITGKMGAGKTKAVLSFAVDWIKCGVFKNVTYLGPRRVLVKDVADKIKAMSSHGSGKANNAGIIVWRFYHGAKEDEKVSRTLTKPSYTSRRNNGNFFVACVNSVLKTPEKNDCLIIDEVSTSIGNVFMNWSQKLQEYTGDSKTLQLYKDKLLVNTLIDRVQNARIVFFVDAALTNPLVYACKKMWNGYRPVEKKDLHLFSDERQSISTWLRKNAKRSPDTVLMIDETSKCLFKSAQARSLAVYDPQQKKGIFTKLEEFETFDQLKNDILKSAYDEPRKRAIIYMSSSATGKRIYNMIFSQARETAPDVVLFTAETMAMQGSDIIIENMKTCRFAISSNVLSCGFSFEEKNVFDIAYIVLEFHANTPPLGDMIQLAARARHTKEKTLKYVVISHNRLHIQKDQLETQALEYRQHTFNSFPAEQAIHNVHVEEFYEHRRHCANTSYALAAVREAFIKAFSHTNTSDLTYVRPSLIQIRQQQKKDRKIPYRLRQYDVMLTRLPGDKKRCFSRRPFFTPKTDLKSDAYDEIKEVLGINVATIENGKDFKTDYVVPSLKNKQKDDNACHSKMPKYDEEFDICEDQVELRGEQNDA